MSTGRMSSTEGPNTVRTSSMSRTAPRAQAGPAVSNPEIFGVHAVSAVQNLETLRVLAVNNPEILPVLEVLQLLPPKVICSNSHSWDHLPVNISCDRMGMKLSTDVRSILHTPRILGILRVIVLIVLAVPAVQNPEILRVQKYPQQQTPKYCQSGSIRSTEPRNTASARCIRSTI